MTDILVDFSNILASLYQDFLSGLVADGITALFTIFLLKIVVELIFSILPFIRKFADTIFMPFNILHQWAHMHKAKQINQRAIDKRVTLVEKTNIPPHERFLVSKIFVRPTFRLGIGDKENTGVIILPTEELTMKETVGLMYAPSKYGFIITVLTLFLTPVAQVSQVFGLIHLYLFFGSLLYLFPSQEDYRFLINTIMTSSTVSPYYFLHGITIFILSSYSQVAFYETIGFPPYWYLDVIRLALSATVIYYLGLLTIIGLVGPDVSLKTQRDSLWITGQTTTWKRRQQDRLYEATQQQNDRQLLEVILAEEEETFLE